MPRIFPADWQLLDWDGADVAELETLRELAAALSDDYTVFHGVHWTHAGRGYSVFGEIDFCVVNRDGKLLVIEQKAGKIEETVDGLAKRYGGGRTKLIGDQLQRNLGKLRSKYQRLHPDAADLEVDYLLYLPHHRLRTVNAAGLDRHRIVDAGRKGGLAEAVVEVLGPGDGPDRRPDTVHATGKGEGTGRAPEPGAATGSATSDARHRRVCEFLQGTLELVPDVNAAIDLQSRAYTRLSGGLSEWARALDFSPFRLRVAGTAGSGKTQLAMAEYRAAVATGRRPMYVCFNQPLASRVRSIAPAGGTASTFHDLCRRILESAGQVRDYASADSQFWPRVVDDAARLSVPEDLRCDTLIVDEGQDMEPASSTLADDVTERLANGYM